MAVLLVVIGMVKWRIDVGALERSRGFAELRLADKYHIAMARSTNDLDQAIVEIDADIAQLDALWFVSTAEREDVRQKWQAYRDLVAAERGAVRGSE